MTTQPAKTREQVRFVVQRISHEELTFAVITAEVSKPELADGTRFFEALREAVTMWVISSKVGRDAWHDSSDDFNVGDLLDYVKEPNLIRHLEQNGIFDLGVKCHAHPAPTTAWTYDEPLMDEDRLFPG